MKDAAALFPYSSSPEIVAEIILADAGGDRSQVEPLLRAYMREHGSAIEHVGLSQRWFGREVRKLIEAQIDTYRLQMPDDWDEDDDDE